MKTVLALDATSILRAVSIVRDDSKPADMRYEVIYQKPNRREVGWQFFSSRKAANAFASEVR